MCHRIAWIAARGLILPCLCWGSLAVAAGSTRAPQSTVPRDARTVVILPFEDHSESGAPAGLGESIAHSLLRALALADANLLPRVEPLDGALPLPELASLGQARGVSHVLRGGVLAATLRHASEGDEIVLQLYVDVVPTDGTAVRSLRAEGVERRVARARSAGGVWGADAASARALTDTPAGRALESAVTSLASVIHETLSAPPRSDLPADAPIATEAATGEPAPEADEEQESTTDASDEPAQVADEDLEQLIAQVESVLQTEGPRGSARLASLERALSRLQETLDTKAAQLESGEETSTTDAQLSVRRGELESALTQAESANGPGADGSADASLESGPPSADLLDRANAFVDQTLSLLLKIQELRAAFAGDREEPLLAAGADSNDDAGGERTLASVEAGSDPANALEAGENDSGEQSLEEVSGLVLEEGAPVAGVVVAEEGTGVHATTDRDGSYTLRGLPAGIAARLNVLRSGRSAASGRLVVPHGRPGIADFELGSRRPAAKVRSPRGTRSAQRILPSRTVVVPGLTEGGSVGGVVLDAKGHPVPRALVQLDAHAFVRTDSRGVYRFQGVRAGQHRIVVRQAGRPAREQRVRVIAGETADAGVRMAPPARAARGSVAGFRAAKSPAQVSGVVLDADGRPIARARVLVSPIDGAARALGTRSDRAGRFVVRRLAPGAYRIVATHAGYRTAHRAVTLLPGTTASQDVKLEPSEIRVTRRATDARARPAPARAAGATRRTLHRPVGPPDRTADARSSSVGTLGRTMSRSRGGSGAGGGADRVLGTGSRCVVRGFVADERGRAREGTVTVQRSGRVLGRVGTRGGSFQLFDLAPGRYELSFVGASGVRGRRAITLERGRPAISVRIATVS